MDIKPGSPLSAFRKELANAGTVSLSVIYLAFKIHTLTLTPWLMEPGGSMPHFKGPPIIPILSRINPIPRIDTYFFKDPI